MNNSPRTGNAAKPISSSGRRPHRCAQRPTEGEDTATTICGTTIQAATNVVAHALERLVTTLAISGSMAAFANWKTATHPAKVNSGRWVKSVRKAGRSGSLFSHPAVGAHGVDLVRGDMSERNEGGNDQRSGDQEDRLLRPEISDCTHARGRETVPDRGEAGVAAEPFAAGGMTDESEADRRDRRTHQAAGRGVEDLRAENGRKDRPERDHQRAHADRDHCECGEPPFPPHGIDEAPPGI